MPAIEPKSVHSSLPSNGVDIENISNATKIQISTILDSSHAPKNYRDSVNIDDESVESFMKAFANRGPIYSFISYLNNVMKPLFRESRESEGKMRMNNYVTQYDTALEKTKIILEVAEKVKKMALDKANITMISGVVQGSIGIVGGGFAAKATMGGSAAGTQIGNIMSSATTPVGNGVSTTLSGLGEKLAAQIDHLKSILNAEQTELDARSTFAGQNAQLNSSHVSFIDEFSKTILQIHDELHSQNSGTLQQLGRTMA